MSRTCRLPPHRWAPLLLLAVASHAQAQPTAGPPPADRDGLQVSGSLRLRYEAMDGQSRAGFGADDELFSVRTAVFTEHRDGDVRIGAELYDSRAYGSRPGSAIGVNDVNALELVQAYIALDRRLGDRGKATVRLGRMTLNLGSRRLVAADDYRNTTNGYTGVQADIRTADGTAIMLIYTLPQRRLPDDRPSILDNDVVVDRESFDAQLWGGLVRKPGVIGAVAGEFGYFGFAERDGARIATRDRKLHSITARLFREPAAGRADIEVEGVYQLGTISAATTPGAATLDVSAWFVHADAGYSFGGALRPRISIEFDHASGDGRGRGYGRFDTLFGMRRPDFGPSGIYAAIGRANITTPGVRFEATPSARLDGFITYRAMWLAAATDAFSTTGVRDASGQAGDFAGHQVEGRLRWWIRPRALRAEINAAWLAKGRFLHDAPNAPRTGDTRYVSLAMTASF